MDGRLRRGSLPPPEAPWVRVKMMNFNNLFIWENTHFIYSMLSLCCPPEQNISSCDWFQDKSSMK